ncbi:MAG: YajQ family cyclic di-GMP-binding protein [Coxiella sp. (in: Bacteria)]|nr:MAG: YajQ family cyclic di-GMP-binding protein [Coxiella sp. (in: g-proteobacteria)]
MPSFDVTCEFDRHEVNNAIDQANREVATRFDFKGSNAKYELEKETIKLSAEADFQLKQMYDILCNKLTKRGVDIGHMELKDPVIQHKSAIQDILLKQGIPADTAKKIVKFIKSEKLKVQASIQGDQVRITAKKRDDLQNTITLLRDQDFKLPLDYGNFRD